MTHTNQLRVHLTPKAVFFSFLPSFPHSPRLSSLQRAHVLSSPSPLPLPLSAHPSPPTTPPLLSLKGVDWSAGLTDEARRFLPYNGAIGPAQLQWLRETVAAAAGAGERIIVLTHVPMAPGCSSADTLLWNYEEVRVLLKTCSQNPERALNTARRTLHAAHCTHMNYTSSSCPSFPIACNIASP